jgi:DNA-directed RNA polymerase subunit H
MQFPEEVKELFKTRGLKKVKVEEKEGVFDVSAINQETKKELFIRVVVKTRFKSNRISVAHVRKMRKMLKEKKIKRSILIGKGLTSSGKKELEKSKIEWISLGSLRTFKIFDHFLVPDHEVLSKEEVEKLLQMYHIEKYQLPLIKRSDPAVKAIGGKPGDIIRITRKSPTAGETIVYRYVVK